VGANYKLVVALIFAIILVIVGIWSSRRRPWRSEKGGKALLEAFTIASLPFILAEVATGVISLLTGQLSIPPPVGIGMAVDLIMLLAGLGIAVWGTLKMTQSKAEVTGELKRWCTQGTDMTQLRDQQARGTNVWACLMRASAWI